MANVTCPHCSQSFDIEPSVAFQECTTKVTLEMEDGHMLQAKTIGGVLTNLATMYRSAAKQLGVNIEVLVKDFRVTSNRIEIEILLARCPDKTKAR